MAKNCTKCGRNLKETAKLKINVKQTAKVCKVCIASASTDNFDALNRLRNGDC